MTLISQLNQCNNIQDVENFCSKLNDTAIQFNGYQYTNVSNGEQIELKEISDKIVNLFNASVEKQQDSTQLAEETSALIFKLKKLTREHSPSKTIFKDFNQQTELIQLEQECKQTIRKDQMSKIVKDYNFLANKINRNFNQGRASFEDSPHQTSKEDLQRLAFLNHFLGIKWTKEQKAGKAPIPLYQVGVPPTVSAPTSLQPNDCKSLPALYDLVKRLKEHPATIKEGEILAIPDKEPIALKDIEQKIQELFDKRMAKDPYQKADIYFQTEAILFTLKKIYPPYQKELPANLKALEKQCIEGVQEEVSLMERLQNQYNILAKGMNEGLTHAILHNQINDPVKWKPAREVESTLQRLETIEFLNEFIGFPLTTNHFKQQALFPVTRHMEDPLERQQASEDYNFYTLLLDYENQVRHINRRYEELNKQLADSLISTSLPPEDIEALKEERDQLQSQLKLLPSPLNQPLIDSLTYERNRLAEDLIIPLSAEQKTGDLSYPVLGRDIALPESELSLRQKEIKLPQRLKYYNEIAAQVNTSHAYKEKKLELFELHRKTFEKGIKGLVDFEMDKLFLDRLEDEIKAIESSTTYLIEDRLALKKRAFLLSVIDAYKLIKLDEKRADLPIIDIEELPMPDLQVIKSQIEELEPDKLRDTLEAWPQSWKSQLLSLQSSPPMPKKESWTKRFTSIWS